MSEHRIEDLEHVQGQIQDLTVSVKELAIGVKNLTTTTDDLKVRMDRQEAEPAENMKIIRNQIITSIISIIVGAAAAFVKGISDVGKYYTDVKEHNGLFLWKLNNQASKYEI